MPSCWTAVSNHQATAQYLYREQREYRTERATTVSAEREAVVDAEDKMLDAGAEDEVAAVSAELVEVARMK